MFSSYFLLLILILKIINTRESKSFQHDKIMLTSKIDQNDVLFNFCLVKNNFNDFPDFITIPWSNPITNKLWSMVPKSAKQDHLLFIFFQ